MKSYHQLSYKGKARRLHSLAAKAMIHFPLEVKKIELVGLVTNSLFRIHCTDGQSYLLRICSPGWRTETDLRSEVAWLLALAKDTDIGAPEPQATRDGDYIVVAEADGVPEPRRCMLMSWIPGTLLGRQLTEANLYKMGRLFARLHAHGASFKPPAVFTQRQMTTYIARDEEDVLFSPASHEAFSTRTWAIFERTREVVERAFHDLYADPRGLHVIHNDLWHDNIKVYRGRLHPFDFEDTIWGYPVQDLAMALQDLMADTKSEQYEPLLCALRQGYESLSSWPEAYQGQIDLFRAGRMLWVSNYVARFERPHLREHIEWAASRLERFLDIGRLILKEQAHG